jgi:hypothetical protein
MATYLANAAGVLQSLGAWQVAPGPGVGGGDDGGGTGGDNGGGGGGITGSMPTITSVVTDPAGGRLVVTFSGPVICPSTGTGAWMFGNHSVVESGAETKGAPNTVTQIGAPSTTCALGYSNGIEAGDFGRLDYTQPVAAPDRVRTADGIPLATAFNVRVSDGVAPTLDAVAAFVGSTALALTFSEPIACSTVSTTEFSVTISSVAVTVNSYGCVGPAQSVIVIGLNSAPVTGQQVAVTVAPSTTLSDQSLDNRVAPTTVTRTL